MVKDVRRHETDPKSVTQNTYPHHLSVIADKVIMTALEGLVLFDGVSCWLVFYSIRTRKPKPMAQVEGSSSAGFGV